MEKMKNQGWLERMTDDPEFQRLLAREDFIEDFLSEVERLMTEKGMTREDLARLMRCSTSNISQLFRRSRDLTASTMVDLAFHLGVHLQLIVKSGVRR